MAASIRRTPLDLVRAPLLTKRYAALLRDDGEVLQIEERLGKRLLRLILPESREGRELLRKGLVRFTASGGKRIAGALIGKVLDKFAREAAARSVREGGGPAWKRRYRDSLLRIEKQKLARSREH